MPKKVLPNMRDKSKSKVDRDGPDAPNREELQCEKASMSELILWVDDPNDPIEKGDTSSVDHEAVLAFGAPLAAL